MSDLRTAAQHALEALEKYRQMMFAEAGCRWGGGDAAINALRAALAQQDEPRNQCGETCERAKLCATCAQALAQQAEGGGNLPPPLQAEPVAWVNQANLDSARIARDRGGQGDTHTWSETRSNYHGVPLYTAPPQRKPLTLEEAQTLLKAERIWLSNNTAFRITRAVERAHGIKERA